MRLFMHLQKSAVLVMYEGEERGIRGHGNHNWPHAVVIWRPEFEAKLWAASSTASERQRPIHEYSREGKVKMDKVLFRHMYIEDKV